METNYLVTANNAPAGSSGNHPGWTIGAGVEYILSPAWSAKLEYDYLDFGNRNLPFATIGTVGFNTQVHEVKLGVNYRWSTSTLFGPF